MTDYGALADKLKGSGEGVQRGHKRLAGHGVDPVAFYESVKAQIEMEVEKANVELRKRDLPVIERIFMPGFLGKLSLTFDTALLCNVDLQEAKGRITAVILGPPNRCEISRKEYLINPAAVDPLARAIDKAEKVAIGFSPDRIAAEVVAGLLMGNFD